MPPSKPTTASACAWRRALGGAGGYLHWGKHNKLKQPMPCAIVVGCAPAVLFTGPQKLADRRRRDGSRRRLDGRAGAHRAARPSTSIVPADAEIVIEGLIDTELLEPEGPFGESHGHVALEDFNMSMRVTAITRKKKRGVRLDHQPGDAERILGDEARRLRADVPEHLRNALGIRGVKRVVDARAVDQPAQDHLRAIRAGTPRTEIWRGMQGAASLQAQCGKTASRCPKTSTRPMPTRVFWSLAYRSNPADDIHVMPYRSTGHGPKSGAHDGKGRC